MRTTKSTTLPPTRLALLADGGRFPELRPLVVLELDFAIEGEREVRQLFLALIVEPERARKS